MTLPDECPFCGSGIELRNAEKWVGFTCITTIHQGQDARRLQSATCAGLERTRLLARVEELEARCKRLEEAGDRLEWRIACGCGQGVPCGDCANTLEAWQQAKEAKP